jgi:hypothetical protein
MNTVELTNELGTITINPGSEVEAGSYGRWVFRYNAGKKGIKVGGSICVCAPHFAVWPFYQQYWEFGQVSAYTRAKCGVRATIGNSNNCTLANLEIICTILGCPLNAGEEVEIVIGDIKFDCGFRFARAPLHASNFNYFKTFVDTEANDRFQALPNPPVLNVVHAKPAKLIITTPAVVLPGERFAASVRAEDEYFNHADTYTGKLRFSPEDDGGEFARRESMAASDHGVRSFAGFAKSTAVPEKIWVRDKEKGLEGTSNYILGDRVEDRYNIYFGDLHAHGNIGSDWEPYHALRGIDEIYTYAREVMNLDFYSHSECAENGLNLEKVKKYHRPGKFVTIAGSEIGAHQIGHFNIYFPDDRVRFPDRKEMESYAEVNTISLLEAYWEVLKDKRFLTIPHHTNARSGHGADVIERLRGMGEDHYDYARTTKIEDVGWGPFDWTRYNDKFLRLVEVFQCRGSFELDKTGGAVKMGGFHSSAQDALALGHRLGFIGSTDCHQGRPGNFHQVTKFGGLAGVLAAELTREAIFDALWERRCFATTGSRIILEFWVNDSIMGSIINVRGKEKNFNRQVKASIFGTARIKQVDIVRNNKTVYSQNSTTDLMKCEWEDKEDMAKVFQDSGFQGKPVVCYYLRVTQEDGNLACSSPVYFEF